MSARPHPFNSHANDLVRDFILDRLGDIASQHPHVTVDYDVVSNASWATGLFTAQPRGVYQEGNNILVKVQGTDPAYRESGGYLLSAHYDSVSTAPGTTDDGMGIVTLLQMVEHFANHVPTRTVIFNFNNNEESGLNGAHTYVPGYYDPRDGIYILYKGSYSTRGPALVMFSSISKGLLQEGGTCRCSDVVDSPLILSCSRPVMFRATNIAPLYSWTGSHVPHPHASVLFADAFSRHAIRSATDYSVYEKAGLDGLDFAFYKGRSRYHTRYDSISGMQGSKKALWAMMEATRGASLALANDDKVHAKPLPRQERPVYFERERSLVLFMHRGLIFLVSIWCRFDSLFAGNVVHHERGSPFHWSHLSPAPHVFETYCPRE